VALEKSFMSPTLFLGARALLWAKLGVVARELEVQGHTSEAVTPTQDIASSVANPLLAPWARAS
jgi:hypothetical protein